MSPRPYQAGERRLAATAATRKKIVDAARALLVEPNVASFSIDAIADRADVARMTVYYQFKSKGGLLEALFDESADRADMRQMRKVFEEPDLSKSLDKLVDVFCHLWATEETLLRRLTALAALDTEVDLALRERGSWRRKALTNLLHRDSKRKNADHLIEVLYVLTSFETYEMLKTANGAKRLSAILKRAVSALVKSF